MRLLSKLIVAGAVLAAVAPAAEACDGCSLQIEAGHWENRTQQVRVPGRWTSKIQNVTVPGRWGVTYQTVRTRGHYKTVNQQVFVSPGWVNTSSCHACRHRRRGNIRIGHHFSVSFNACAPHRRWVPGHYKTVRKRVFVPGCAQKKRVRTWIPACTTQKRVRVWEPACYQTRTVRVWVSPRTTTICD